MGGYGSAAAVSGQQPTAGSRSPYQNSSVIGSLGPGCAWSGSLVWTNTTTGERVGSIGYEAHLGQESGRVRLKYTTTRWDGEKRESDYWIQLETTPQPFGGRCEDRVIEGVKITFTFSVCKFTRPKGQKRAA
jgi:hypothetical protein